MADSLVMMLYPGQTAVWKGADNVASRLWSADEAAGLAARRGSASLAGPCPDSSPCAAGGYEAHLKTDIRRLQATCFSEKRSSPFNRPGSWETKMTRRQNKKAACRGLSLESSRSQTSSSGNSRAKRQAHLLQLLGEWHSFCSGGGLGLLDSRGRLPGSGQASTFPSLPRRLRRPTTVRRTMARLGAAGFGDLRAKPGYDIRSPGEFTSHSAMGKAFSSMVYMIKTLQSCALQIRSALLPERDIQDLLAAVHSEINASFLWLFQQVFSRTPVLMVSVMLLFADFTAHSVEENLSPSDAALLDHLAPLFCITRDSSGPSTFEMPLQCPSLGGFSRESSWSLPSSSEVPAALVGKDGCGGRGAGSAGVSGEGDGWDGRRRWSSLFWSKDARHGCDVAPDTRTGICDRDHGAGVWGPSRSAASSIETVKDKICSVVPTGTTVEEDKLDRNALWLLLEKTAKEMELKSGQPVVHLQLDQETIRQLVAPIQTAMEPDDYACFDRTDLQYQEALSTDAENPLLLSNYAQFRYVVRQDIRGAEELFRRALKADVTDGNIIARYASFLWLARGDKAAADRAYQEAIASDPDNPYYTGSYAHFLWHADDGDLA